MFQFLLSSGNGVSHGQGLGERRRQIEKPYWLGKVYAMIPNNFISDSYSFVSTSKTIQTLKQDQNAFYSGF